MSRLSSVNSICASPARNPRRRGVRFRLAVGALGIGVALLATALFLPSKAAAARTRFYVAPTGSNANPGTTTQPWRTIQKALDTLGPGQTASVRGGTYWEEATMSRSGQATAWITLRAYPGERPVVTGRLKITGSYFRVRGFRFRGSSLNATSALVYLSGATHVVLIRNKIASGQMSGIYIGDSGGLSRNVTIVRNYIHDNGTEANQDHGIYCDNLSGGLIANNIIVGNKARGVQLYEDAKHVIVTQNTIVGNLTGVGVGGEGSSTSDDNVIANNIIAFNRKFGISTYWPNAVGSGNVAIRNLLYANADSNFYISRGGLVNQSNIFAPPGFVDRRRRNFHLRAGSRAINTAVARYSQGVDYDGDSRPQGLASDIGMDEWVR